MTDILHKSVIQRLLYNQHLSLLITVLQQVNKQIIILSYCIYSEYCLILITHK